MSCKTLTIPVGDIITKLVDAMNLEDYAKVQDGTLINPTLKGMVSLDATARDALCNELANCILNQLDTSDFVSSADLVGTKLVLKDKDGHTIGETDLRDLLSHAAADRFLSKVDYSPATKTLVFTTSAQGEPDTTFSVPLSDLVSIIDLNAIAGDGIVVRNGKLTLDDKPCTLHTQLVQTGDYTATVNDDIILMGGGKVNFPTSIPVGKAFTVIQVSDNDVTLASDGNMIAPRDGSLKLGGQYAMVTVVKVNGNEFYSAGDTE